MLSEKAKAEIRELIIRYPKSDSVVLPALHIAEREYGWLTPNALSSVAEILDVPKAHVRGVATFHNMFRLYPFNGRHIIRLCTNVSCMLFGAEPLVVFLKNRYGVSPGISSPDYRFELEIAECIGACDMAPAMLVDNDFYGNLTAEKIIEILDRYK